MMIRRCPSGPKRARTSIDRRLLTLAESIADSSGVFFYATIFGRVYSCGNFLSGVTAGNASGESCRGGVSAHIQFNIWLSSCPPRYSNLLMVEFDMQTSSRFPPTADKP
jgi:hypothetical protein